MSKWTVTICMAILCATASAQAQIVGKPRPQAAEALEQFATAPEGVTSGSCLRAIGDPGSEEFALYFVMPKPRIEGFVVEFAGDDGAPNEIASNAGIVSFTASGDAIIRDNLGAGWVADSYRVAVNFIRSREMVEDPSYAAAFERLPTERCPAPYSQRNLQ